MSRGLLRNDVTDAEGNAVQGALVTVYVAGTLTKATLYSESVGGVIIANPLTTDVKGVFQAFVETGEYDLAVVTAAGTENVYNIPVLDADDVASIEANLATSQQQIDDLTAISKAFVRTPEQTISAQTVVSVPEITDQTADITTVFLNGSAFRSGYSISAGQVTFDNPQSGDFWALIPFTNPIGTTTAGAVTDASRGQSVQETVNNSVQAVDTLAELKALPAFDGAHARINLGGRAGNFRATTAVMTAELASDPQEGIYVAGNGVTWVRQYGQAVDSAPQVRLSWFGIAADGVTLEQEKIRSAIANTPNGGELVCDVVGTVLLDIGVGELSGFDIDKPITMTGNPECKFKIKDNCTAYQSYSDLLWVFRITSSNTTADGLYVIPNADNHYEEDGGGTKFWETGPALKRPPGGGQIICLAGEPNLENSKIVNCHSYDSLAGFSIYGTAASAGVDDEFIKGTATTSVSVNCHLHNNTIERARGNAVIMTGGVRSCTATENHGIDVSYHMARFYTRVIDCHAHENHCTNDYQRIADRYNASDLGYWRTDDDSLGAYPITRTGYKIGSSFTASNDLEGNVRDCSMHDNTLTLLRPYATSSGSSVDVLADIQDTAPLTLSQVTKGCALYDNKVYGEVKNAAITLIDTVTDTDGSCAIYSNTFDKLVSAANPVAIQGSNLSRVYDNVIKVDSDETPYAIFNIKGERAIVTGNEIDLVTPSTAFVAAVDGDADSIFIDQNIDVRGNLVAATGAGARKAMGSETGGVDLTLGAGFAASSGGSYDADPSFNISDNTAIVTGTITGSSASQVIFDIDSISARYRAPLKTVLGYATVFTAGTTSTVGQNIPVFQDDFGQIKLLGYTGAEAGEFGINLQWPTRSLGIAAAEELTISSGAISPTGQRHFIDTEANAASDDLTDIVAGSDGDRLILMPASYNRVVTVKHNTGNINLAVTGADKILVRSGDRLTLVYSTATAKWVEQ